MAISTKTTGYLKMENVPVLLIMKILVCVWILVLKWNSMAFLNTTDRTFLIDDSDKELFIMMKSICDTEFATDEMMLDLYKKCWEKKKKISYHDISENTVYIHFPRINPIMRFFGGILLRLCRGWIVPFVIKNCVTELKKIDIFVFVKWF